MLLTSSLMHLLLDLLKLESYPFPTIQTESSSLMTFVNTSQRVCYNGTVSYLVDFGGVKPICNAFIGKGWVSIKSSEGLNILHILDIRNSTNEWLIIAAACVTGSFVFSIIITFIIKEIRMSIIRNLGKKLVSSVID